MYEPVTWGMIDGGADIVQRLVGSGFTHVPGGSAYANKSAYSFHYYCWLAQKGEKRGPYPSLQKAECDGSHGLGHAVFDAVEETIGRLGGASMMTEFGGTYFSPDPRYPNSTETLEQVAV